MFIFDADTIVVFRSTAFKHGIDSEDILHALKNTIRDEVVNDFSEKHAAIGFNRAGNYLEILFNQVDDNHVEVFHAMKVSKGFLKMYGL